jgi:hypothetical protein
MPAFATMTKRCSYAGTSPEFHIAILKIFQLRTDSLGLGGPSDRARCAISGMKLDAKRFGCFMATLVAR